MFCCTVLYVTSSIVFILIGKRELVALLYLSSWCLVMVEWLFLAVPWGCLRFVIVFFADHTHLLFLQLNSTCQPELPPPIPRISVKLDHGYASRIYFDNAGDNVTLTLNNVISEKPC